MTSTGYAIVATRTECLCGGIRPGEKQGVSVSKQQGCKVRLAIGMARRYLRLERSCPLIEDGNVGYMVPRLRWVGRGDGIELTLSFEERAVDWVELTGWLLIKSWCGRACEG
jgi:hypothetical protein